MIAAKGTRAVIYTRVSRDDTGEAKSNARQREDCEKLADLRGWDVVAVHEDVSISAYSQKHRPGWEAVLRMVTGGEVDLIVAWHFDRMTRSMRDLEDLILLAEDHGVGVATVSGDIDLTTDVGRMVARILAAVARQEVERKGARQSRANQQRASAGVPWTSGWRPFGYEIVGSGDGATMVQVPAEAELVRQAARDVLNGASLKSIAKRWRESGLSTPRSDKGADGWTHNGVKSILLNPRNAGRNTYKGQDVGPGNWEPIFSLETHHQLVALLTDPQRLLRRTGSNGRTPENLLTGIATCGTCGSPVVAGSSNGKKVYKCKGDHITTDRLAADTVVLNGLWRAARMTMPGTVLELPESESADGVTEELRSLDQRQAQVAEAFAEGSIPHEAWERANNAMNAERAALEARLAEVDSTLGRAVQARSDQALKDFDALDLAGRRDFLRRRAEVVLHSRNRRRNVPIEQQVTLYLTDGRGERIPVVDERER